MIATKPKKMPAPPKPAYVISGRGPSGALYVGDALAMMPRLTRAGMAGTVDLFFADPPFNIGHDYGDGFNDRQTEIVYQDFTNRWVASATRMIRPGGALFMHLPDHVAPYAYVQARRCGLEPINTIILHQEFGQYGESKFIGSHVQLLYFVKPGGARTWNVEEILEPSQRLLSGDPRVTTAKFKGMRPMLDVWSGPMLGRVQGNNDERWGTETRGDKINGTLSEKAREYTHPNQLPELYMARIIRCASKEGQLIFDPFCGSCTSWAVARALGRRFVGTELSDYVAESGFARARQGVVRDVRLPLGNNLSKLTT